MSATGDPERAFRVRRVHGIVSTDDILPARYKHSSVDPADFAPHVFENVRPGFAATIRPGDALVGDDTFGIGSSREQAVSALLAAGVGAVLAPAFGRIFFRNAWNLGLLALELEARDLAEGAEIRIDLEGGRAVAEGREYAFAAVPQDLVEMVRAGGLLARLRRQLSRVEHERV
jgi:3-isopropylmalate/(R)-2-methylmalate dehydratase small subunit